MHLNADCTTPAPTGRDVSRPVGAGVVMMWGGDACVALVGRSLKRLLCLLNIEDKITMNTLPQGFTVRPPTMDDVKTVFDIIIASDTALYGAPPL